MFVYTKRNWKTNFVFQFSNKDTYSLNKRKFYVISVIRGYRIGIHINYDRSPVLVLANLFFVLLITDRSVASSVLTAIVLFYFIFDIAFAYVYEFRIRGRQFNLRLNLISHLIDLSFVDRKRTYRNTYFCTRKHIRFGLVCWGVVNPFYHAFLKRYDILLQLFTFFSLW